MYHLAMFGTDYLELIAAPPGNTTRPEILAAPEGLNGIVFGTEDANETHAAMTRAGIGVFPPDDFSRPVTYEGGVGDATFRTVRLTPGQAPSGRIYFCQHLTRGLVWRDEWRHHANGATGVERAVIVAADPAGYADLFAGMFGADAVRRIHGGRSLTAGVSRVDILTPDAFTAAFRDAGPDPLDRETYMAALTLRSRSLDTVWGVVQDIPGVRREAGRVIVPAREAFGAALEFVA